MSVLEEWLVSIGKLILSGGLVGLVVAIVLVTAFLYFIAIPLFHTVQIGLI